jgi:hypothetical protein
MACNPPEYRPAGCSRPARWTGRASARKRPARTILESGPGAGRRSSGRGPARPASFSTTHRPLSRECLGLSWC